MAKDFNNLISIGKINIKDEFYTPRVLVEPILKYLKPHSYVWCPFDTEESEFVIALQEAGHKVVYSHIWYGQDFFNYLPPEFEKVDYIISNPPFSMKLRIFDRLYQLGKPFAMICSLPILNYPEIGEFFLDKNLQLLIVDKKVSFDGNPAAFNNSYFCCDILPRDLMFEHLPHNNTGENYKPSKMSIFEGFKGVSGDVSDDIF